MVTPSTLARDISPPPTRKPSGTRFPAVENTTKGTQVTVEHEQRKTPDGPSLAAIEAGEAQVRDHLAYFSQHFRLTSRKTPASLPRITIDEFQDLYNRNQHPHGRHFVIHQHDHPISGNTFQVIAQPSVHADEGKACITICDYSSHRRALSVSLYPTASRAMPIL
jgi:hypothetical protein